MRALVGGLCLLLLAAAPKSVSIKKTNGELVRGTVVTELESGFLIRTEAGKNVKVAFDDIAELTDLAAPAPAAAAPSASPPPAAPVAPVAAAAPDLTPPPGQRCPKGEVELFASFLDDEGERRSGTYCVNRWEVRTDEYAACVAAGHCNASGLECGPAANWGRPDRANHPINCVSALQAEVYCSWRRARLPSAGEWEGLASIRPDTPFPWGESNPDKKACWSGEETPRTGTCPIGTWAATVYTRGGLLDMAGNVWEWTSTGDAGKRVFMGGAWNDTRAGKLEVWSRNKRNAADVHYDDVGFRCVRMSTGK